MNNSLITTEELIQKIIDRQAELIDMSVDVLKNKPKKEPSNIYKWFEEIKTKNEGLKLSKAV